MSGSLDARDRDKAGIQCNIGPSQPQDDDDHHSQPNHPFIAAFFDLIYGQIIFMAGSQFLELFCPFLFLFGSLVVIGRFGAVFGLIALGGR